MPGRTRDLIFLNRDWTHTPCNGSTDFSHCTCQESPQTSTFWNCFLKPCFFGPWYSIHVLSVLCEAFSHFPQRESHHLLQAPTDPRDDTVLSSYKQYQNWPPYLLNPVKWEADIVVCCCCSVAHLGLTLCDPMDCSTPGFPVLHCLPGFAQTHVHWVDDAIQPSHPLLLLTSVFPTINGKWVSSSYQAAKVLEFQLPHQYFQWIFRVDSGCITMGSSITLSVSLWAINWWA